MASAALWQCSQPRHRGALWGDSLVSNRHDSDVGNRGQVIGSSITLGLVDSKGTGSQDRVADSEVL
jgi:hypothetical protein